ncbi:hypothetical protein HID58_058251 [Brassica napus]|uniref:RRM domain-containing protein n=1 Tax=Brassica napus TaxID=3708 RepID=A0ABQ7ZPG3_BRANA|nr:hypothetical protein HID58_058251 [Brassica napus]
MSIGGDSKKMEAEPKDSLSAADLDMPSLELRSTETFNRGSASDLSMFSSSLPTLLHENLNMTDSDSWLSLDDKLGVGNSENDSLEEDVEPDSLETLLPEDENELLPGLIDELNFNGLPDELEECDVFCTGGGMELDVESQENHAVDSGAANSFVPRKRPNTSGRVSVEHPNGEHPSRTLFVRNINSSVEDSELTALFEPFGEIRSLYTACKSRGFVMISYYDIRASHAAMRALQNTLLRKRTLDIHFSIPKENPSEKDMNQGTLVIFNVDTTVSNDELLKLFGAHGEIREIRETPNRSFHRFIEYYDVRDAESALKALDRSEIGGNWPVGSPVKGSPSHTFPRPHGLGNMPGLASILPGHQPSRYQGLLNHPNQTILNKGLLHNVAFGQPHSLPEHIGGGISNSMRFIAPPHSSGFGTSSDNRYRWGSPPQHFNYPGYTGASSSSSSKHGFPFAERQGSLLGKYQHHVGSAPSSSHFNTHMNRYTETSSLLPLGFGDMGINKSYTNAHGQANVGVNFTGSGMSLLPTIPFGGSRGLQSVRHEPFAEQGRITHFETQLTDEFKNNCNMGYAFVNMVSPLHIVPFQQTFSGKVWENFNSGKVASLAYAEIQGKSALASYMQNPSPMKDGKHLFPQVSHYNDDGQDANDQEQPFSSIWNITALDPDWSYTTDKNVNSKNIVEEESF